MCPSINEAKGDFSPCQFGLKFKHVLGESKGSIEVIHVTKFAHRSVQPFTRKADPRWDHRGENGKIIDIFANGD